MVVSSDEHWSPVWLPSQSFQNMASSQGGFVISRQGAVSHHYPLITSDGRPVLGSPVGTNSFITEWVTNKVLAWVTELEILTDISHTQPQTVHSALSHRGLICLELALISVLSYYLSRMLFVINYSLPLPIKRHLMIQ